MAAYTDDEKATAVALYLETGNLHEAARSCGAAPNSVKNWAIDQGHDPEQIGARASQKTEAATKARTEAMRLKRETLREELATAALHHVRRSVEADDGRQAQAWMTAGAIGVDKLRLELGEVTDLTGIVAAPERTPEQEAELDRTLHLVRDQAA